MAIGQSVYIPVLKWRQGEYQALLRLAPSIKDHTVPLIEVTPPDFDFETNTPTKTVDEHLGTFPVRLQAKWGARPALLDCGLLSPTARMSGVEHPMLHLWQRSTALGANIIPVVRLGSDPIYRDSVRAIQRQAQSGVALRCTLDEVLDPDFAATVATLLVELAVPPDSVDLILDLGSPNWEPEDGLIAIVIHALTSAHIFQIARSTALMGSSFPKSMSAVTGPIQFWPRREWSMYRAVLAGLSQSIRKPTFGDYTISGPTFAQGDMRLLKPSATIRYACQDGWIIAKGNNVRDNGFDQYRVCSGVITGSSRYLGAGYSAGSAYIDGCHKGTEKTGNLTTWRWVGTNHHITKVVLDLATLSGA